MNKTTLSVIFSVSAAIILLLIVSVNITNSSINKGIEERKEKNLLQELIDKTANTNPIINESLKGKTVVINVWATWCGPCIKEMPELNKLVNDFASDDIRFIALDELEAAKEQEAIQNKAIDFDYELYFEQKHMIDLLYSFKLGHEGRAIPLHIILNKEGNAEIYHIGNQKENIDAMRAYLTNI